MFQDFIDNLDLSSMLANAVEATLAFLPHLFIALAIFVAALVVSRGVRAVLRKALKRAGFQKVVIQLLVDRVVHYAIVVLGTLMALGELGINVTAALAGVGVAGIAIGFAAQDTVANIISGILIFWDKPFVVGDWIETEGEYGEVTNITLRTTRIRTPKNTYIIVPNKRIIDEVLENFSKHGEVRVDIDVGIAYKEDVEAAREALLGAIEGHDNLLSDPAPDVVVSELGGSSVNLKLRVWIEAARGIKGTHARYTELAKKALDDAGIEIPFPHLQLIVDTIEERVVEQVRDLSAARADKADASNDG